MNDRLTPGTLVLVQGAEKETVEKQIVDSMVLVECLLYLPKEAAANDASAAPHQCNSAHVKVPAILLGSGSEQHITLCVGDNLGTVKCTAHIFDKGGAVAVDRLDGRPFKHLGCGNAFLFQRREAAREYRLPDECYRLAEIERTEDGPLTGTFLSGGVKDLIDNGLPIFIFLGKNMTRYLDEVTVKFAFVPIREDLL